MKLQHWLTLAPTFIKSIPSLPIKHLTYHASQLRYENPHRHDGQLFINTFFPPNPSKAFETFLAAVKQRKRIPFSAYFAITHKCPYTCPHCSYARRKRQDMDTKSALNIIAQLKNLPAPIIGFTGGEPLLRDDLPQLIRAAKPDAATILFTTGHNLTPELAQKLKIAGLDSIMFGIESPHPKIHDNIRRAPGSFDQTIKALKIALETGFYTAISTIATPEKIANNHLLHLANLAKQLKIHEFRILQPVPTGRAINNKNFTLTKQQSQTLTDFHKSWNRKNPYPAISSFSHLESPKMFGCGAAHHHLFIDSLGNVCPCDLTPLSFGNALETPLSQIWKELEEFFALPRTKCLMADIKIPHISKKHTLPIPPQQSRILCQTLPKNHDLPKIYKNYLNPHKPEGPKNSQL